MLVTNITSGGQQDFIYLIQKCKSFKRPHFEPEQRDTDCADVRVQVIFIHLSKIDGKNQENTSGKVKCRKVRVDILSFCESLFSFCQQAEEDR